MTTSTRSPAQRGAYSRNKGVRAERDVVAYLRAHGFGGVERAVRTGYQTASRTSADPGDLTGIPGVVVSIKDAKTEYLDAWLRELDEMDGPPGAVRVLIHKRPYKGDVGRWWCWLRLDQLDGLLSDTPATGWRCPVRMEVGDVVALLHGAGYGDGLEAGTGLVK